MRKEFFFDQNLIPLIIPSYEPDERLLLLLENLLEMNIKKIIIVDDGSGENYKKIFDDAVNRFGVKVLRHEQNRGKGAALKTAFNFCLNEITDLIGCVTADSDGQHSPDCILKCMNALYENPSKLIMGCRDFTLPGIPQKSILGNKNTNKIINNLYGTNLSDTQTGLRGLSTDFMHKCLEIKGNRFEYEIKMLSYALAKKIAVLEVPIDTIYDSEKNHSTHFRPIVDTIKIYSALGFFKSLGILISKNRN